MFSEQGQENLRLGNKSVEKYLERSVTAAFFCPRRQSQHCDPTDHGNYSRDDPAQLPHGGFGYAVLNRL